MTAAVRKLEGLYARLRENEELVIVLQPRDRSAQVALYRRGPVRRCLHGRDAGYDASGVGARRPPEVGRYIRECPGSAVAQDQFDAYVERLRKALYEYMKASAKNLRGA